ncbi:MAG: hypothetical protein WAK18_18320 [Nocardioidaceae bacterium]
MRNVRSSSKSSRRVLGVSAVAVLALTLAACSGNDSNSTDTPKPVAQIQQLSGNDTSVALDAGFVEALTSLKLTPGVVGDASLANGAVSFPITGGNVTYYTPGSVSPYVTGLIDHEGSGLSLTAGGTTVDLTNFEINPGNSRVYGDVSVNGKSAAKHATIFNLDGRTLKPLQTQGNEAVLEGTKVMISGDAAALLDQTFQTDAVKQGLLVGIATITVNTK